MPAKLTPDRVGFFRDEGYLLYQQPVFPAATFSALKQYFDERVQVFTASTGRSPEHMDVPHFADPTYLRWLLDDAVLDLVEPLIGPDIALFSSHFLCKPAGKGKRVPWHEDSAYWRGRLDPMEVVTVWLAVDESTPENGCMRVIPRTHHDGYSEYDQVPDGEHSVFPTQIRSSQFDEGKAVDCVLQPNQCSLHHARMIHGSNANLSAKRRCGYTMRYCSTAVRYQHERDDSGFQLYLARGRDRAGNRYGDPTRPNAAWLAKHPQPEALIVRPAAVEIGQQV